MSLSENLQNLRKIKNMSQEEFAEQLGVSRQAVSKWESGSGYPETEKLIQICEIFDCSMDELVKGKITVDLNSDKKDYDSIMKKAAKGITIGVGLILLAASIMLTIMGICPNEAQEDQYALIGVAVVLLGVTIAVPLFIVNGLKLDEFKKKNPKVANIYSEQEVEAFTKKSNAAIACGVGAILLGVMTMLLLLAFKVFGEDSVLPVAILMYFITTGVSILVYAGQLKDIYNIEEYNRKNSDEATEKDDLVGKICGVIMLIATAIFLFAGFVFSGWGRWWVVFPIGGIICGIVSTIMKKS